MKFESPVLTLINYVEAPIRRWPRIRRWWVNEEDGALWLCDYNVRRYWNVPREGKIVLCATDGPGRFGPNVQELRLNGMSYNTVGFSENPTGSLCHEVWYNAEPALAAYLLSIDKSLPDSAVRMWGWIEIVEDTSRPKGDS